MTSLEVIELKEHIKTYAKIKKINEEKEDSFIEISSLKNKIILKDIKNLQNQKNEYPINKVFLGNDEYSYIYEDITLNSINDSLNQINTSFFTYGNSNSGKHSLLFGSEDCINNINLRGIFPRLIESIILKENIKINISLMFIYEGKVYDISKICNEKNKFDLKDFINDGLEIGQNSDIIEKIIKIKINSNDDLLNYMKYSINFFNYLQSINYPEIQNEKETLEIKYPFIFSFSTFIYVIYIYNDNKKKDLISNITFIELPGNDELVTKVTAPNSPNNKKMYNTKHFIENTNIIESIKKSIYLLKKPILLGIKNITNPYFNLCLDSKIMIILKNLSFSKINTRFRFIGCLNPIKAYQKSTKDTLDTLFQIHKIIYTKNYDFSEDDKSKINKDTYIITLEERLKDFQRTIKTQSELITKKQEKNNLIQNTYQEQINILKKAFNFQGDINVLLSGNEDTKEFKYAKKIRDAFIELKNNDYTIQKLKEQIKSLNLEIEKNNQLNEIKLQDKHMIEYLNDIKERGNQENNKLRIHLDHDIKLNELENENKKLNQIIDEYKKENDNKFKFINNLPNILNENCDIKKKISEIKNNIQSEYDQKLKNELSQITQNNKKENEKLENKYKKIIQLKDEENSILKNKLEEISKDNKNNYNNIIRESVLLYKLINNIFQKYKKEFSSYNYSSSIQKFNNFILSKEKFQELLDNTEKSINMFSFPITLKEVNSKYNNLLNKGDFKLLKIDPIQKMSNNSIYSSNTILMNHVNEAIKKNEKLEKENEELKQKLEKVLLNNISIEKLIAIPDSLNPDTKVLNEKEKLRIKLDDTINRNLKKEMIIKSQLKSIERLNNENLLLKSNYQIKSDSKKFSKYSKALNRRIYNNNFSNKKSLSNINSLGNNTLINSNSLKKFNRPLSSLTKSGSASLIFNKK
jgi:hypothetical protein